MEIKPLPVSQGKIIKPEGKLKLSTIFVCLSFFAITTLLYFPQIFGSDLESTVAIVLSLIFIDVMFFLMVHTGKTDSYRFILFVVMFVAFVFSFGVQFYQEHGRLMLFTRGDVIKGQINFCPIALPNVILPMIFGKELLFGAKLEGVYFMLFLTIGLLFFGGRSLCSWNCFFAGIEECASRCAKKTRKKLNRNWIYFSFAVLIIVTFLSPMLLDPIYCDWICPLKAITEYEMITSFQVVLKTIIFVVLFAGLCLVIPFLTRKRGSCSFFCPFGALLSLGNKISPFNIRIDKEKCINCKKCLNNCPMYAISEDSLIAGKACINCSKCGKCIDLCPTKAIHYHIKGTKLGVRQNLARLLFVYPTMLLYALIGGGMIYSTIYYLLRLATTGSLIG